MLTESTNTAQEGIYCSTWIQDFIDRSLLITIVFLFWGGTNVCVDVVHVLGYSIDMWVITVVCCIWTISFVFSSSLEYICLCDCNTPFINCSVPWWSVCTCLCVCVCVYVYAWLYMYMVLSNGALYIITFLNHLRVIFL